MYSFVSVHSVESVSSENGKHRDEFSTVSDQKGHCRPFSPHSVASCALFMLSLQFVCVVFVHISSVSGQSSNETDSTATLYTRYRSLDEILMLFRWTKEEKENLLKYYKQSRKSIDTISEITEKYEESGFKLKSQISVIEELLEQNIITIEEYDDLLRHRRIERKDVEKKIIRIVEEVPVFEDDLIVSDTKVIRDFLQKENKGKFLIWLQNLLLETCYVKLILANPDEFKETNHILEPIVYYFALLNLPVPLVPWTVDQANILKHQPFVLLLHKLGFYLPVDTGKIFVRIPNFWTPDYMFSIAQLLGPIDKNKLKFDVDKLRGVTKCSEYELKPNVAAIFLDPGRFSMPDFKLTPSVVRYTPLPNSTECFQNILRVKVSTTMPNSFEHIARISQLSIAIPDNDIISCNMPPPELTIARRSTNSSNIKMDNAVVLSGDELERFSNCDTASVASDLTRMCVSDEDDKVILIMKKSNKIA